MEFAKLTKIMEIKGKILWNIKTKWISTIGPIKHVFSKYCTLIMKMALDALAIPSIESNLFLLIDVETLLGLNAMTLTLKAIHLLIKFALKSKHFVEPKQHGQLFLINIPCAVPYTQQLLACSYIGFTHYIYDY